MTKNRKRDREQRELARDALRRAAERPNPDMSRLREAVPAMMAEAARRRRFENDTIGAVIPLAWKAIPRLAAAAALLLLASATLFYLDSKGGEAGDFDTLIYSGTDDETAQDLLYEAILQEDNGNG